MPERGGPISVMVSNKSILSVASKNFPDTPNEENRCRNVSQPSPPPYRSIDLILKDHSINTKRSTSFPPSLLVDLDVALWLWM